jgi:hypothetical protein
MTFDGRSTKKAASVTNPGIPLRSSNHPGGGAAATLVQNFRFERKRRHHPAATRSAIAALAYDAIGDRSALRLDVLRRFLPNHHGVSGARSLTTLSGFSGS